MDRAGYSMTAWIAAHRKILVYIAGVAVTAAVQVWGTDNDWVALAVLVATGLGIYQFRNVPAKPPADPPPPPP